MKVVCCVCGKLLSGEASDPERSDSYCDRHYRQMLHKIEKMHKDREAKNTK